MNVTFASLNTQQRRKLALLILILAIALPVAMFRYSYDEFAPKHTAIMDETASRGSLPDDALVDQAPGFYAFGAILSSVCQVSGYQILYYPILAIPFSVGLFAVLYSLSRNLILSSTLVLITMMSGITGTSRLFFWMNALGGVLLFLTILSVTSNSSGTRKTYRTFVLLTLIGLSMIYLSYNYTGMTLMFLLSMIILSTLTRGNTDRRHLPFIGGRLLTLLAILLAVEFMFSEFFYRVFVPTIMTSGELEFGAIDKFLLSYLHRDSAESSISGFIRQFPSSISVLSAIKYAFLSLAIILFLTSMTKSVKKKQCLSHRDCVIASVVLMSILFSVPRLYIGGTVVPLTFLPGILCVVWLFDTTKQLRALSVAIVALLLVLTPIYYYENVNNNLVNNNPFQYDRIVAPAQWSQAVMENMSIGSDELTGNLFTLYMVESGSGLNFTESRSSFKVLTPDDVEFICHIRENATARDGYIINYGLNTVILQSWTALRPWSAFEDIIDGNAKLNVVYDCGSISILLSNH